MDRKRKRNSRETADDDGEEGDEQEQQQQKVFCENCDKIEVELSQLREAFTIKKLKAKNRALQAELANQKLEKEIAEFKAKLTKMEQEQQKQKEKEENDKHQQTELWAKRFDKMFKKFSVLDNFAEILKDQFGIDAVHHPNCWNACHSDIAIIETHCLRVNYKGEYWRRAFAKHSISNSEDVFYFEILVKSIKRYATFGIANKQKLPLSESICDRTADTFAYANNGNIWVNGSLKRNRNEKYGYGDTVGFGLNLATKKLIFSKNGKRIGPKNLAICSYHFPDEFFPFVSLFCYSDKIEANFGPKFMFDLATL